MNEKSKRSPEKIIKEIKRKSWKVFVEKIVSLLYAGVKA
jgi:hypothetical protein